VQPSPLTLAEQSIVFLLVRPQMHAPLHSADSV
jgi:hypothetical protein